MPAKSKQFALPLITAFKELHKHFMELMELKPWTIVDESVILAVKHPVTGEIYYAYFMGELGEVPGFNLYRGEHIAPWLRSLENIYDAPSPSELLLHTFYQLAAAKKSDLDAETKDLHAAAGITAPRGKAGYLEALVFNAGFTPAMITESQIMEIIPLLSGFTYLLNNIADKILIKAESLNESGKCYIATQQKEGSWQSGTQQMPEPGYVDVFSVNPVDKKAWASLKMLPKSKEPFILQAQLLPIPSADEQGRGAFPLILLCIGAESKIIFGVNLIPVSNWKDDATIALAQMFEKGRTLPSAIHIADERMLQMASEIAGALGLEVFEDKDAQELLEDIMDSLMANMGM